VGLLQRPDPDDLLGQAAGRRGPLRRRRRLHRRPGRRHQGTRQTRLSPVVLGDGLQREPGLQPVTRGLRRRLAAHPRHLHRPRRHQRRLGVVPQRLVVQEGERPAVLPR
jgi:hypothetical protein